MDYEQTNQNQIQKSSGSLWKWIIIIVVIIAAAVFAWYVYLRFYTPQTLPYNSTAQAKDQNI